MNKEEFDINQELEQMRQDYAALKERFDKQQIINGQLMQNAMKMDVRRLFLSKKSVPAGIALTILAVILSTTETLRRFKKRYIVLESGICLYFFAFVVAATLFMTSMNISAELMWRRGILIAIRCVATLALEYYFAKRLLNACDDIIGRLKMKDE